MQFKSPVLVELSQRNLIKDCTNFTQLDEILHTKSITLYCGFDLTAASLHVGNLVSIMIMRIFVKHNHNVIALVGGATSKIGDPSFKDAERPVLTADQVLQNKNGIKQCLLNFLPKQNVTFADNIDWFENFKYIDFLNEVGRFFTISKMLSLESVKLRIEREQSISFTEFNYSLLQAYDFYHLAKHHNCILQIGGSDQWGNITSGTEFARKKLGKEVFGLTTNLITTSDGKKMGKSVNGAVWLLASMLDPMEYFQYFRNVDDKDVLKFLYIYTDLAIAEIKNYENLTGQNINTAKDLLAFEATKIAHGQIIAQECLDKARSFFNQGNQNTSSPQHQPEAKFPLHSKLINIMVSLGFCNTNSNAKQLITQGGVKINEVSIADLAYTFQTSGIYTIVVGKKNFKTIQISDN